MRMTGIILVLALVFVCLFSFTIIAHAEDGENTDTVFTDVIMNVGKDETERNVTWYSNYDTEGEVQYARVDDMTGGEFPAEYSTARARVSATNENGSYAYKATLRNLEADTRYVYRLITGSSVSTLRYFDVKDFDDSFSFIYVSDPQVGSSTYKAAWIDTLDKISESFGEASFIVSGGDQISTSTAEGDYDNFIVDGVSEIAIAPTNGPGHDNTALYTDHYNLPNLSTTYGVSTATSDYYYTYNNALFVHLNMDVRTVSEHLTFIENAIKNSPEALWHIVVIHWSFYSGSTESQNATIVSAAENMVGRMNELGVDLVLSGHDHFYARSQLVTDYRTVSDDVVVDNTVTNPKGTLYVCGSSATGNGITAPVSSEYSAYQNSVNRKSIINITVNEESLSLNAYFVDGATPELFDSFTINRTSPKVRVGFDDGMLKLKVGDKYLSLVDAYAYTRATVKVIDGYWSVSTDKGASFTSLGIAATSSYENSVSLKINESTGYWQLSEDGGASYADLPINVKRYTVTYVTDKEPYPDLSVYSTSTYVEGMLPDPPAIVLPAGSFDEGVFYKWSWEFKNSDGTSATSFTAGNEYVAYVTAEITSMPSELYIGKTTNESAGVYTWADAWAIAIKFPDEKFTFVLNENVSVSTTTTLTSKTDVTVDLAGYTLTTTSSYALNYNTGSTGSSFALISSKAGGTVNSKSFVCLTTSQVTSVNVSYGSDDGYPITLNANDSTYGYLLFAGGNFKRGSTVNFTIKNGTYTATNGILYVDNAADDLSAANHYKVNIDSASITLGKSPVCFKGARKASASSFMNVTDSSISISSGTAPVIASDQWYGSFSFTGCDINGVTFPESGITNITGATFGDGTTFTNSDETFNSDKTAFASAKLSLGANCSIRNNGGTLEIYEGEKLPDNVLLISKTSNESAGVYTWADAWAIAIKFPDEKFTFVLNENVSVSTTTTLTSKTDVTVDLAGYTLTTTSSYALNYNTGSTGSSFALISSKAGGTVNSKSFVCLTTSQVTSVNVSYGSDDGYPITLNANDSTYGYLLFAGGNFKRGSTVNFTIKNGTYTATNGILYVDNAADDLSAANHYKVNIDSASITLGKSPVCFKGARKASASSFMNVTDSSISISSGTAPVIASDQWYGSFSFTGCDINGVTFPESGITNITGATFGDGTTFTNSDETFNSDKTAFASAKLSLSVNCSIRNNGGTLEIYKEKLPDNVLLISKTSNNEESLYTWNEAWNKAMANPSVAYIFRLTENTNLGGSQLIEIKAKCNVTLDLAGYAIKVSVNSNYLIAYGNGSTGSSFSLISSREGGSYYGPTLVFASSSGASSLTFNIGSADSYPITVTTFKTVSPYSSKGSLLGVNGNFKNGSTLTATVTNGTYVLEGEILSTNNYSGALNTFKVTVSDADVSVGTAVISFASTHNTSATSFLNVYNSSISASAGTVNLTAANQWFGSFEFENCDFDGIVFNEANLTNIAGGVFKNGCTFANFGATFTDGAFTSAKLTCEEGYAPFAKENDTVIIDIISKVVGINLTLAEDISINFFVVLNDVHEGAVMRFTVNGNVVFSEGTPTDDGRWKFVFTGIGPQAMTVPVYAEIMFGGEVIYTPDSISVKGYCDILATMTPSELGITEEKYDELMVMVTNLLKYGSCAQIYKEYNLENLADADIDESLLLDFVDPNEKATIGESSTPGMSFTGATVWFDTRNSICIRFTVTDLESTTVKVNGKEYDSTHFNKVGENTYTFFTDSILPAQYMDRFVFELCLDGETQQTAEYSIACYVSSMQNSSNESMKNLAMALYNYSMAVVSYND